MGTPGGRFSTALLLTAATTAFAACDREVAGPDLWTPSGARFDIGILSAPVNDDFDAAIVVRTLPFTSTLDTGEATTASGDPFCVGQGPTVWYAFTPTESGFYEANTIGSDYDTTLGAYVGTRGDLTELACNDDLGTLESRVVVELQAGETVYFMVGAYESGPGGNLVFNLLTSVPPPPPLEGELIIDEVGVFDPRTGVATLTGTLTCSRPVEVDLFGVLQDRIGRIRVEAFFGDLLECDGSIPWQVQVFADNALLVGGPVSVQAVAVFYEPDTGEFAVDDVATTVRLRSANGASGGPGGRGGGGGPPEAAAGASADRPTHAFSSARQVILKVRAAW